jgi:hypothetical protein
MDIDRFSTIKEDEMGGVFNVHEIYEKCTINFYRKSLKKIDHLEDLSVDSKVILKWILKKEHGWVRNGLIWLIRTSGELLRTR